MTDTDSTPNHPKVLVRSEQSSGRIGVIESVMPAGAAGDGHPERIGHRH